MAELSKVNDVEMVALSVEQTKPLIGQTSQSASADGTHNRVQSGSAVPHSEILGVSSPTGAEPTSMLSSPTHEFLATGSIPKNRKRPGSTSDSQRVTMTGTVTRGNSIGQPVEVELELTETEFLRLTSREPRPKHNEKCECSHSQGVHIIFWSFLCIPAAALVSICMTFYNGCMTWYNLIIYFSEEKSIVHKLTLCPLLILSFPLTVGMASLVLALAASVLQLSWSWYRWWPEFCDGEKGFCGWLCSKLALPNCSPYQVVVLDDSAI